jgi:hypothetical protein
MAEKMRNRIETRGDGACSVPVSGRMSFRLVVMLVMT